MTPDLASLPGRLRDAGADWAMRPMAARLAIMARVRRRLRGRSAALIRLLPARPATQSMTAEILPLLAACRFLEREAARVLAPRRLTRGGTPWWLAGTRAVVERRPFGAVLVLAPGNYPLMLPGIHLLQALVAGNAVAFKPAPGHAAVARAFLDILTQCGVPDGLCVLLDDDDGPAASSAGFDLIVLTGSARTGHAVAMAAARTLTPLIAELSGSDAVFVLPGADLDRVARALAFGAGLNGGATCIAPRRVFVQGADARRLSATLRALLASGERPRTPPPVLSDMLQALAARVVAAGGVWSVCGGVLVIEGDARVAPKLGIDLFAPWLGIITIASVDEAMRLDRDCPYALGASIFGPEPAARAVAAQLGAGSICINDLIVPTADPRLPFGGARASGFGATRGVEGLLAMTRPVAMSTRRRFAWHLLARPTQKRSQAAK